MRIVLLVLVLLALGPGMAAAQPVTGFYVSGGAGLDLPPQQSVGIASSASGSATSSASAAANATLNGRADPAESASAGWGFGDGVRVELQGTHATALPNGP